MSGDKRHRRQLELPTMPDHHSATMEGTTAMATLSISNMTARTIDDWIAVLEPMGYWQAGPEILKSLRAYPADASERDREHDSKQVGNALIAWAIITAKEIQEDLRSEPEPDFLLKALDHLGKRVAS
jgi:hypothetical protein